VVVIVHDNNIIFSEALGYADLENKIPATLHSRFSIQLVTKIFTATMLMQLVQRGQVLLNDDVKRYVPELGTATGAVYQSGTTLLQLATHTSGLPRNSPADINFAKQVDRWLLTGSNETSLEPVKKTCPLLLKVI
jgi:CubicO group peptidase (beta-lactamase class C family)